MDPKMNCEPKAFRLGLAIKAAATVRESSTAFIYAKPHWNSVDGVAILLSSDLASAFEIDGTIELLKRELDQIGETAKAEINRANERRLAASA